jgi:predicted aspartyl protease
VSSPRAVIEIEGRVKVAVLLDTGADVNIIIIKVADAINLSILEITSIKVKTFTGYNTQLIGICREINV